MTQAKQQDESPEVRAAVVREMAECTAEEEMAAAPFGDNFQPAAASAATPDLSKKQFVKNLAAQLFGFGLGIVSAFFLTPYWIKSFGIAGFGLVPLTNNLVGYFGLITVILSSSVSRFITVEVGRGNYDRANRIFNTSLWASVGLSLLVFAMGGTASFFTTSLIDVPKGFEADSQAMMLLATVTFVLSLLQTPFNTAMFCANRIDLNSWVTVVMRVLQIVISVGLVATIYCRPGAIMAASLAGTAVGAVAAVHYWRRLMPWSRIARLLDFRILYEQVSFGIWSFINLVGAALYLQIDLLVINRMLGPTPGGQYAALAQWSFLIRSLGGTISSVFAPTIMHYYARNDIDGVVRFARWSMRMLGLLLALPIGLICGLAQPLLTRWLGTAYAQFDWLLLLMVLHLCVNIAVHPLFAVQGAVGRVKVPAIVTCVMGVANAATAVALTYAMGMYGVALAGAVMLTAKNIVFTPLYAARILQCRWHVFFGEIVKILLLTCAVTAVGLVASHSLALATWPRLVLSCMAIGLAYLPVVWFVFLSSEEHKEIRQRLLAPALARVASVIR